MNGAWRNPDGLPEKMDPTNHNSRCGARTKSGKPCRAAATSGGLCFFHANPKKAVELGRIGGRRNGRARTECDPLPDLDSATDVRDAVKRLISDVYEGKLNPRTAAGLAPLLQLQLRAIEKTDFEQRLANTEKQLTRLWADLAKSEHARAQTHSMPDGFGKRPPQAVKPSGSVNGLTADKS